MTDETPRTEAEPMTDSQAFHYARGYSEGFRKAIASLRDQVAAPPEPPRPKDVERLAKLLESNYGSLVYNDDWQADARAFLEEVAAPQGQPLDVTRLAAAINADIARRRPLEAGQPLTAWSEVMRTAIFIRDEYARLSQSGSPGDDR